MERKYNRKVMIAKKPIHSHNRGPNQLNLDEIVAYSSQNTVLHHQLLAHAESEGVMPLYK